MKKGFTLIEMIGVMVILSLLMLFAMPNVINYIKKGGDTEDKVVKTMIYEASKQYITDNQKMFKKDSKNTYCISLNTLATEGYIESPITLSSSDEDITSETSTKAVKVTYDKNYKYELTDECVGIVNPTPILYSGLTPVMYDGTNWVVANPKTDEWYNYDKQMWANAVVLGSGKTKKPGEVVTVEGDAPDALMMLVWIPRYEYKIEGQYGKGGQSAELPGEIEVNFIGKNIKTPTEGYIIHPAFNFDGEKSGFWVGKFELSHSDETKSETSLECTTDTCSESQYLRILPKKTSLRNNNVSNLFYAIRSIENTNSFGLSNIDTHMMKNSEWGAVAYLSQSKYGKYGNRDYENKYKEVYQNKSDSYITGLSNGTPSQEAYRDGGQCSYNDMTNLGVDGDSYKMGLCGPGASTTGNIYGVYDMSGGAWEYVMGTYGTSTPTINNSGFGSTVFTGNTIESKYYDIYKTNDVLTACDNNGLCLGHAMSETASWYGDYTYMFSSSSCFLRGGNYVNSDGAGVFNRNLSNGDCFNDLSARVVGFGK